MPKPPETLEQIMPSLTDAFIEEFNRDDGTAVTTETGQFVTVYKLQADGSWKVVVVSLIRDPAAHGA